DRATDEMMDGYLNYITVHEDLNIQVKNGRLVSRASEKGAVTAPRANQTLAALGRPAVNQVPKALAGVAVKPSPKALAGVAVKPSPKAPAGVAVKPSPKPPASVAVKPSPAAVEPQSAIARAKDITGPPPKGAGGSASSLSGGEIDRRANANLDNPGRRRYL